jgi:hypothetical protein
MPYNDTTLQRESQRRYYDKHRAAYTERGRLKQQQLRAFVDASKMQSRGCSRCRNKNILTLFYVDEQVDGLDAYGVNRMVSQKQPVSRIRREMERRTLLCQRCIKHLKNKQEQSAAFV